MNNLSVRLVFDRKHVATKMHQASVQLEVTYERKRKFIGTGIRLSSMVGYQRCFDGSIGVTEKPKRKHYIRNGILYALITMSLALILIVAYIKYWDYLMMFWFIMVALMLIGLFGNIKR